MKVERNIFGFLGLFYLTCALVYFFIFAKKEWVGFFVLALAAGVLAAWWTQRARLGGRARLAWCLASLVLGVPALLSLMVLQPRVTEAASSAATRCADGRALKRAM